MRPPSPTPNLDRLRQAIEERVQETSLRAVARQVGMSPSGLQKFLDGGVPYQKSRRKLFEWLHRENAAPEDPLTPRSVAGTLAELVSDLPYERREPALEALVETLRSLYETHRGAAPDWLAKLPVRGGTGGEEEGG